MDRATILAEIRRAATESGGKSLGRTQFERLAGISEGVWLGKYWLRWSDAVIEAGFTPGRMQEVHPDEHLFECLAVLTLKRGHFPTASELKMERTQDKSFPNAGVFERLGSKSDRIETLRKFARAKGYDDVLALLPAEPSAAAMPRDESSAEQSGEGHVYMLKLGKHFKVGRTFAYRDGTEKLHWNCLKSPHLFTRSKLTTRKELSCIGTDVLPPSKRTGNGLRSTPRMSARSSGGNSCDRARQDRKGAKRGWRFGCSGAGSIRGQPEVATNVRQKG
jgi:hypothetical protein